MSGQADPGPDIPRHSINWGRLITVLLVAIVGVMAYNQGRAASEATSNCGELPGISRAFFQLFGIIGALAIILIAGVAARIAHNGNIFVAGVLIGLALAGGIQLGERSATYACGPGGAGYVPDSTEQTAVVTLAFGEPYPGEQPTGPARCQRPERGRPVNLVRSDTNASAEASDWRFQDGLDLFVDFMVSPAGSAFDDGRLWLRFLVAPGSSSPEAIVVYTEASGGTVTLDSSEDRSSGSLSFSDLAVRDYPVGDGSVFPTKISGLITWSCIGAEK